MTEVRTRAKSALPTNTKTAPTNRVPESDLIGESTYRISDLQDPHARSFIRAVAKDWGCDLDSVRVRAVCDVLVCLERWRAKFPDAPDMVIADALHDTRMDRINENYLALDYLGDLGELFSVIRKLANHGESESINIVAKRGSLLADEAINVFDCNHEQANSVYDAAYRHNNGCSVSEQGGGHA